MLSNIQQAKKQASTPVVWNHAVEGGEARPNANTHWLDKHSELLSFSRRAAQAEHTGLSDPFKDALLSSETMEDPDTSSPPCLNSWCLISSRHIQTCMCFNFHQSLLLPCMYWLVVLPWCGSVTKNATSCKEIKHLVVLNLTQCAAVGNL